jgi:VanZ family protein
VKVQGLVKIPISNLDKVVHFGIYFVFTLVWFGYFSGLEFKKNILKEVLKASLLAFFAGISIELLQEFLRKARSGDVYDVLANSLGILMAVVILYQIKKYKELNSLK